MPRPAAPPSTALGVAIRAQRDSQDAAIVASEIGVDLSTLYRLERGAVKPSVTTAIALARWLNWTVEAVVEAATTPALPLDHVSIK